MAKWKTHKKWVERFLEWGDSADSSEDLETLIDFPKEKGFITSEHDFNRRIWRSRENRNIIQNAFGEEGLLAMDLHYCLDFLKEETYPEIIQQRWKVWEATFPQIKEKISEDLLYPSVKELARYLATKTKNLNISKEVFKFVIVNFREILTQLTSEHGYKPEKLRDWKNPTFNLIFEELGDIE